MKQIDYLRKSRKICSALLMACALTFMLLTTTLSFAQTNSLTLGCPTRNGNNYQYAALSLTAGDGVVRSISISFSENPDGCSISLPSTSWTVSGNEYSRYIIPAEGATSAQIQAFLQGVTFNVPNGTLKGVNIILSIDDASRQIFYFAGNGHYYEYVPYDGTKTWTIAYNEAKGKEYCGRPGYLATLTTADEDAFVTRIVQNAMWIGGTRLSPTDDATSTGTQYYANFDTDDEVNEDNTDYWYWACGPEKGARITNEGAITNSNEQLSWYTQQPREPNGYTNWMYAVGRWTNSMYSAEPNNSGNESCLTVLRLGLYEGGIYTRKSENTSTTIGNYVFGWNDVTYEGNNTSSAWRPQGYLVEYGDQSIGHSQTDEACSISASGLVGNATRTITATLSGSTAVCAGEEATLNIIFEDGAFPFTGSVQGNNGEVVHTFNTNDISYNFTVAPTATTSYTISTFSDASSTTGSNGCSGVYNIVYEKSGSVTVTVNNPQVALNDIESVAICAGASTTLTATTTGTVTDNVAYAWSTGATENEITVAPSATTTYTVTATATQGGCTATATKSVAVTVNTPQVALNDIESVAICAGASTTLTATTTGTVTDNVAYAWSTGATGSEITVTPSATTTYTVTATATQGECTATATKEVTVRVNELPTATVSVTDVKCEGAGDGIITVNANGGSGSYQYQLGTGDFQDSNEFTGLNVGSYTLTVKDGNSCTTTTTATIDEPAQLTLTIVSATDETCTGNDGKINYTIEGGTAGTAGYTVVLSGGSANQTANQTATGTYTFTGLEAGTYTVTVTDGNTCVATATATVMLNNNFTVSASNTAICSGVTFTINPTASHTAKYSWAAPTATGITGATADTNASNISGTLTNTTTSAKSITYTVAATTANGLCTATPFNVEVTVYAPVTGGSIQKDFIVCNGLDSVVTLTNSESGNGGVNGAYIWQQIANGTTTTIDSANGETYTPRPVVGTVQYQRVYTTGCGNQPSNVVSVTNYGNVSPGTVVCSNGCAANYCYGSDINVTLSTSGINVGSGTTPTIQWQQSVNGGDWTNISGANATTYTYNKNNFTEPIKFRYTIQLPSCDPVPSNNVHNIGVWALPVVSIADVATLCPSAASTGITGTIETPTTPNYTYYWSAGSGLTLPTNLPESPTSATSNTIRGTFSTTDCNATYSASLYVIDGHGCTSNTVTKIFTVVDTVKPTFTCPSNTEVNCDADHNYHTISSLPSLSDASDNCTYSESLVKSYKVNGNEIVLGTTTLVPGSHTVAVTVTDLCGNDAECTYTITVGSNEEPLVTCPGGITVECYANVPTAYANYDAFITAGGTVTDDLNAINETSFRLVSEGDLVGTQCDGTITRTYGVKDAAGNEGTCTQVITIQDNIAPTFTRPADITIYTNDTCGYDASVSVTGDVTNEADNCSTGINATYSDTIADGDCAGKKIITRTWSLVDKCGNAAETQVQTITVLDTTAPSITCSDNFTQDTDDGKPYATVTLPDPIPVDNCSATYSISYSPATPTNATATNASGQYPLGVTTVTYSVVDGCGNADSCSFTITVSDNQAPVIACAVTGNQDVLPNSAGNTYTHSGNSWNATATDNVAVVSLTYTLTGATDDNTPKTTLDGQVFNYGTTTVTWKATDNTGASDVCSFQVVVADNTKPDLTCPTITAEYECLASVPATYADYAAFTAADGTATDNHQINESSFAVTETVTPGCPTTITRTYSIKDMTGNEGTCTQVITVEDKTAPALKSGSTLPAGESNMSLCFDSIPAGPTVEEIAALYEDNCGGEVIVSKSGTPTGDDCGWNVTYTYVIKDTCNNEAIATVSYSGKAADFVMPANGSKTVQCIDDATAPTPPVIKDACGTVLEPKTSSMVDSPSPLTCEGTRTYTYTYEDCAGHTHDWTYTYTIDRTTAPAQEGGPVATASTVQCIADATAPTTLPVVKDVCGKTLTAPTPVEGGTYTDCEGTKTYTYTYEDCSGLQYVWTYTYTIDRTTAPTQDGEVATSSTVQCAADATAPTTLPVVKDVCENTLTAPTPVEGGTYSETNCAGTKTYTYTYKDCAGLEYVWTYTYTIDRTIAPTQVGTPVETESTVECIADATAPTTLPVVKDVCENTLTAPTPVEGGTYSETNCAGTKTYTYTYKDCAGLEYVWTYTYTIDRTIAPTQVGTPVETESTVECIADATAPTTLPVVKDVCGNTLEAPTPVEGGTYTDCEGTKTYTYTYEDCSGLQFVWTYTYTIEHTTAPAEVGGPVAKSSTVECATAATAPTTLPEVKDVCGNTLPAPTPVVGGTYTDCEGTKTYTYTYKDCSGLEYVWTYTYTIDRTTAPAEFGTPVATESTVECIADATAPTTLPVVKDVCGNTLTAPTPVVGGTYTDCEGTKTYTYTYKDCAGLEYEWTYTYTIDRTTAPSEDGGPVATSSTVECAAAATAPTILPVVKDVCGNTIPAPTPVEGGTYTDCEGTKTYTYTYEDCAGLQYVWTYTYTIERTTAPNEVDGPVATASTVGCIADATAPTTLPVVKDVCGNTLTDPTLVEGGTYTDCEGTKTYTYTYEDCSGLQYVWTYTYTITAPTLTFSGSINDVENVNACYSESHKSQLLTADQVKAMYTSSCSREISVEISDNVVSSSDCNWKITRTYSISDGGCNTDSKTMSVSGSDQTAPALAEGMSLPSGASDMDLCYAAIPSGPSAEEIKALYVDNCSEVTVTKSGEPTGDNCEWSVIYTYVIEDACHNATTATVSYSGSDQTAPAIGTDDLNRTLTSTNCVFRIPDLTTEVRNISNDLCTPNADLIISQSPAAGTVLAQTDAAQNVTVTVTVKDLCGNESTKEVVVVVPTMMTVTATATPAVICNGGTSQLSATAANVVGTAVYAWTPATELSSATIANPTVTLTATGAAATTTYTVQVTDDNGCTATATASVTVNPEVVMDAVDPMTLCVGDVTSYSFTTPLTVGTMSYAWTNSNTAIGLGANGDGDILSFTPTNTTDAPINATITVTPSHTYNDIICVGDPINFTITVRPSITTPGNVEFACPADTTVVLSYSDCEQVVNIGEPEFVNNMSGMTVNITNDAPEGNIFPEGTTVVTWTATDECGAFLTCTQNVVIQFPPCGDTIADFDGYRYSSVRIGCQCWTGENARSEHYSDGTPVDNFRYYNDSDSLENIYGKLYTWYTAVRVPEGDNNAEPSISTNPFGTTYVQGICPEGWALPTVDEYMLMIANSGDATHAKDGSNLYWLPGYEGQPPFSGFDAYGAGKYNGAIDRYQELLGKTHFWTTLSGSGSETATTVEINYYCAEGLQTKLSKGDGVSIRCIRKR